MIVRKTKDGKNGSVQVSGWMPSEVEPALLLDLKDVFTAPREGWKGIRLDAAVWAIQEKAGIYLWWGSETKNEENLILVCESGTSCGLRMECCRLGWIRGGMGRSISAHLR